MEKKLRHTAAQIDAAIDKTNENETSIGQLALKVIDHDNAISQLNELFGNGVEGYVRISGVSDPNLGYLEYKHTVGTESVFDCLKPCLVGNNFTGRVGNILHVLNPLDWYHDEFGDECKLDGSEGEVMICNVRSVYEIAQHITVRNVTYDVFLRSYVPFEWQGHPAVEIKPMGVSPHFCVAHNDDDNVTRMHSVYNPDWDGSYNAQVTAVGKYVQTQAEDGTITEEYDPTGAIFGGAGGLHTTNLALYTGEQYAMNLNDDATATVPYYNATMRSAEVMYASMVAEGGTFDAHNKSMMGSGFCCNDVAVAADYEDTGTAASNGARYLLNGSWVYMSLGRRGGTGLNPNKTGEDQYNACHLNSWRSPWSCMEQQRVMMYAIEHNVQELTWFAFEGNKYKWRHVDGFAGPSEGAMTAVVWKLFSSKLDDDCEDSQTKAAIGGCRIEYLFSSAIYRGQITDVSPSWWISGLIFTEDENGTCQAFAQRDQSKLIKSVNGSVAVDQKFDFETQYDHVGEYDAGIAYRKDYNDNALMMPKDKASQSGGSLHTYVGGYQYLNGGKASAGTKASRGFRRGYNALSANLSPVCFAGSNPPSNSNASGAFGICCEIETGA